MKDEHSFDQIRENIEAKQRSTIWPDTMRNGISVDAFLWKGDPNAKPVQRIGLVVFALAFLLIAIIFVSIPFQDKFEDGWSIVFFMAMLALLLSLRLLRNAFLRTHKHRNIEESRE